MSSHSQDHNDDDVKKVRPPAEPGLVAGDEQSPAVDNPDAIPNPEAAAASILADTSTVDSHFALRVPLLQTGTDPAQGPTAFVENLRTKEHVDLCSGCSSKLKVAHMDERMLRRYGFIVAGVGSRVDIPIADFRQMMEQDRGPKARKRKRNAKEDKVAGDDDDERAEEPNGDDDNEEEDGSEEDDSWDELNADAERALRRRNKARKLNVDEKRKKSQKSDVAPAAADEGNGIDVDGPVENGVKIEVNGTPAEEEEELMETEDGQQRDGNEEREEQMEQQPEDGQSSSTAGRWLSKKTTTPAKKKTKPLSARQMRVDTEDEEEDEEETQTHKTPTKTPPTTSSVWLSKGSGSSGKKMDKDKDHVSDSEAADGNGSDSSSGAAALRTSLKPTRDQFRKNKEVLRLLNENPKKSGDEDEEEADGEGEAASRRTTRQQAVNKDEELIQLFKEKRRLHLDSDETDASEESNNNSNDDDNHLKSSTEQSQADSAATNGGGEAAEKATTSRSPAKKRRRPFNASNSDEDDANDEDYTPGGHKQQPKQPPMMGPSTDGYEVLTLDSGKKKKRGVGPGPVVANGGGPRKRETAKKRVPTEKRGPTAAKKPRERKISTTGTTKGQRKKRRNNRVILSDDEEEDENDDEDDEADVEPLPEDYLDRLGLNSDDEEVLPKRGAAKGTRVLDKKKLTVETREAERAERDRRKRLEEKQKEFNGIELVEEPTTGEITFTCDQAPVLKAIVLDPDKDGDPPNPVRVHPSLVRVLKKHQAEGIQFLYNCTIESLGQLEKEDSGGGAILGHCMGLGKTLQIIGFLHTILTHSVIRERISRVLIVVPKNVVLNWVHEFDRWLFNNDKDLEEINYVELDQCVTHEERLTTVKHWHSAKGPSVLIIGYEMFRILTLLDEDMPPPGPRSRKKEAPKKKKKKLSANEKTLARLKPYFRRYLHEGPHMVVCDEGHKLKNCETGVFSTMNKIVTRRRICMTGTPLQNKLKEYYCMVNFIKPSLLGNWKEFKIRFASIIEKGRSKDATPTDVRWMRQRCHVLFERLKGVLDRRDYTVLRDSLPPKQEYFINVRLTLPQINLIHLYMEHFGPFLGREYLSVHAVLYRIWTHPYLLIHHEREVEKKRLRREDDLEMDDFVVEDDEDSEASEPEEEEEEEINADEPSTSNAPPPRRRGRRRALRGVTPSQSASQNAVEEGSPRPETPPELCEWAKNHVSEADRNNFELSNKLMLLVEIIKKCEEIGDKLLVFSQFLDSIGLIERMLAHMEANGEWFADGHAALMAQGERWGWKKRQDYDVIDGSVSSRERDRIQTQFNDPLALRNRLLLISTKAGSLGTNLIGANRVVIFDCCWNPSHDTQALFRVYRFGQVKPVYIYRLVAQGTMEERIYNRQVTKESIAKRVTQAAQIQRHYTEQELGAEADQMYEFNPAMPVDQSADGGGGAPHLDPPKDRLLGDIILKGADTIVNYQYHDLLFNELEDEALSAEERDEAWQAYDRERQGLPPPPIPGAALLLANNANGNVLAAAANNNSQWLQQQASIALIQQALQRQQQQSQQQQQQQQQVPSAQRQSQQQLQLLLQQMLLRQRQQQQQQQSGQRPQQQHPNLQAPTTTAATTTATPAAAGAAPAFRTALAIAGGAGNPPSSALAQQAQFATTMETVFRSYITDSVYNKCMKVKGMTTKMAVQIFQIKQFLRFFVCQVPEDFRPKLGTLNNAEKFEEYFAVLLDRALEQGEDPRQVQRKAWMTLKATVNMVREVPQCLYGINYIARLVPEAFTTG